MGAPQSSLNSRPGSKSPDCGSGSCYWLVDKYCQSMVDLLINQPIIVVTIGYNWLIVVTMVAVNQPFL